MRAVGNPATPKTERQFYQHVVFGSGPLGLSVVRELVRRGKPVRMVNGKSKPELPPGVELLSGDAYDATFARQAAQDAAVVYQCAQPGYTQWPAKFPPLQESILEAAAAAGARLIVGENLYMYGEVDGPIHEGLPYAPNTRKGKVRAAMAEAALAAHRLGKVRVALARGSDFFGPQVLGSAMGDRVFLPALKGKAASVAGRLDVPHTYTFIDDFGRAMVVLGEHDGKGGTTVASLGSFSILLITIYIFAQIFLLGAVITRVYAGLYGSRRLTGQVPVQEETPRPAG